MRMILRLPLIMLACSLPACRAEPARSSVPLSSEPAAWDDARRLENVEVEWAGSIFGLWPYFPHRTPHYPPQSSTLDDAALIDALDQPDRFVAAHVVLTYLHGFEEPLSTTQWNMLRVRFDEAGNPQYDLEQMQELKRYWANRLDGG